MIPICEDLFEVIDYPATAFVFELAPESNLFSLTKLVMYIFMYFQECKTQKEGIYELRLKFASHTFQSHVVPTIERQRTCPTRAISHSPIDAINVHSTFFGGNFRKVKTCPD